ncbi:ABC transporter ATP-binding protein [Flagellimonas myxillae]|uniref:ABC transporter ATP-binding protein n=1 Tax=Flagellimonas myxillae TaxID=2942214 RepID=UPI00201F5372|nr:ABC transporter ATP-binding protein [Muricauda myxillae]MCL6265734.1 ABC transporter ATP-binding protein [Muricauda myxillae]
MMTIQIQKQLDGPEGPMRLDVNIQVAPGEFVTLYGSSGAGKTSTLKILSGLMQPEAGKITVGDKVWLDTSKHIHVKPQERNIGYVFQDYALFPNMSVKQNLEFALPRQGDPSIVKELIQVMELNNIQQKKPTTLSGGQQQRVALARTLVQQPKLLLLDEPLSALDLKTRLRLQDYLQKVHRKYLLTTILISHDIGEIHKLSDRVIVLEEGRVIRQGTPSQVFVNQDLSGKFKFQGAVLQIEKNEVVYIVTVLVQNQMVKVIAQESEIENLKVGDAVIVASKAFNPILYKIE